MTPSTWKPAGLFGAVAALLFTSAPVSAQQLLTGIEDLRIAHARATWNHLTQTFTVTPDPPFSAFDYNLSPYVDYSDPEDGDPSGYASAFAFQYSSSFPTVIHFSGAASGNWGGDGGGSFEAYSSSLLRVQINETVDGAVYAMVFTCSEVLNPLVASHPTNQAVPRGSTANFNVTPAAPFTGGSAITFQWRKNGQPLTNNGHIAGATTATLTIFNADYPDTGYYDVVLDDGSVTEPSSLARLDITGTVGVDPGASKTFSLGAPTPNPFGSKTVLRYEAPRAFAATISVHDVSGRVVRRLPDRTLASAGSIVWDGITDSGTRATPGIYFLNVEGLEQVQSRRLVLLR